MLRPAIVTGLVAAVGALALRTVRHRGATKLLAGPRTTPEEAALGPALDALGGEIVRLRARDGLRLAARWLPWQPGEDDDAWTADPHEAILLIDVQD